MKFGAVSIDRARGHTLAHSLNREGLRLPKGHVLTSADISQLNSMGLTSVTVAQLTATDIDENTAAGQLAAVFETDHVRITQAFSGRVNLIARKPGILRVHGAQIDAFNGVDEAITIATLRDYARVHEGTLLATIKIIPYAADREHIRAAAAHIGPETLNLHPLKAKTAKLILSTSCALKPSMLAKAELAVRARVHGLGMTLTRVETVAHTRDGLANALKSGQADMTLILGASATSDRMDAAPAALCDVGGSLIRFGMPVDPGNLLFLGEMNGKPVVGLPGCSRSPALNGADWVLERLAADMPVSTTDIAAMGVGGLLKEVPARTQPRRSRAIAKEAPYIVVLAAGTSSRMRGENKLLREIDGEPLVVRTARRLSKSKATGLKVVINSETEGVRDVLKDYQIVVAAEAATGLAASLRAGINALPKSATAVIVALGDMPEVSGKDIDALIDAHQPLNGHLIIAPTAPNGKRGNPVLFDRRYFEPLASLTGDAGAKVLIEAEIDNLRLIPRGTGVLLDLDTPEAWAEWSASRGPLRGL